MKKVKDGFNTNVEISERKVGRGKGFLVTMIIVMLIVLVLLILIKMDVGGFGRKVLRPILKDIPIVREILPEPTEEEIKKESGFQSLAEAVAKIDELEKQIKELQTAKDGSTGTDKSEKKAQQEEIDSLKAEVEKLKVYEKNQKTFENTKEQFYKDVVYNDNVDVSNYTSWYETMDKDTAAKLYKEAVQTQETTKKQKELAESYANMKPENAAKILENMSGDMDTVVAILNSMSANDRGQIMGEMTPSFAAKVTKKITS